MSNPLKRMSFRKIKKVKMYGKPTKYRSKLEENVSNLLEGLGVPYKYESEQVPYTIQHHYTPDFVLPNQVILETKGYWNQRDRRKILAVKKENPYLDLRMVFLKPYKKISKKSKTTYAMWCEKHNIPWTYYQNIPLEWLN